jgi:Carboxypeptidase regulatory-like domain
MKKLLSSITLSLFFLVIAPATPAQDTVTGAFEGIVTNSLTGDPIEGAIAEITNLGTGITYTRRTDARGRFYQGQLSPGAYRIRVSTAGFQAREVNQRLQIATTGEVVPVPVSLDPLAAVAAPLPPPTVADTEVRASINTLDARRSGSFSEVEVVSLPLGAITLTRTFDELALLLPGVAPPPQTLGSVAGPGVGAGVGSAGQFSVNGLRSRANNFTVDGSDNNDEDIGVRRQGFVALIPQPIESVKEYQAITLLAPAQFGRNLGAVVNAVSKSGGAEVHGSIYGFFNSSKLNTRNFFDSDRVSQTVRVRAGSGQEAQLDGRPLDVTNNAGGEDSFTLAKFGATIGGPIIPKRTFYFLSAEGQIINAVVEEHFATPTPEQRGAFGGGASGLFRNPFTGQAVASVPASAAGNAFFSLFPFPNQPDGVYGANTFTQALPASARGAVFSVKLDHNFKIADRAQSVTGRYNFTDDQREIAKTGEAIFSTLRPEVRAQNFSFFFNSQLSANNARRSVFHQARLSYGRTRLRFVEGPRCAAPAGVFVNECLTPSSRFPGEQFLLNRPEIENITRPATAGQPNTGPIVFQRVMFNRLQINTEDVGELGPLGQALIAGFSPIGVDVYNFPQRRVNNTYQAADILTLRAGDHNFAFGADARRTELNSNLPRVSRPFVTFNGAPPLLVNRPFRPEDLASTGAPSNFFLTLTNASGSGDSASDLGLRFYQLNLFAQDDWRLRSDLTFSYGLRFEYNTPPSEINDRIVPTFNDPALGLAPGLRQFLGGREEIFDPDRDNLAPRVSLAYAPRWFGRDRVTVFRAGFGIFYDQILGAVVSQSRNVYPTFLPLNFGGQFAQGQELILTYTNPATTQIQGRSLISGINRLNLPLNQALVDLLNRNFPAAFGLTLPSQRLETPTAMHYSFSFEQQLKSSLSVSAAYVGTQGRHLLRFTTPNLGPATNITPTQFSSTFGEPFILGRICVPSAAGRLPCSGRPVSGIGAVYIFETGANSRYDSLQVEIRGRYRQALQAQASYVLSSARDDVSDVFDLAGAFSLPQNSLNLAAERGTANFDIRHRVTYSLVYDLSDLKDRAKQLSWLLNGLQLASIGRLQTGQPFTANSIFDINLDGNLTDRLNTTDGLSQTGDGRQPLILAADNPFSLLAAPGQDGRVGRNTFRGGGLAEIDLAVSKAFRFDAQRRLLLRADFFNLLNRANFGVPARLLDAPGFGKAVNTVTPGLRAQLGLKLEF